MNKKFSFSLIAALVVFLFLGAIPGMAAEEAKTVALFPFEAYSTTPERAAQLRALLYRGLTAELQKAQKIHLVVPEGVSAGEERKITDAVAAEIGKKAGAEYAVLGSVSELGGRISVDAKVIDLGDGKALPAVFVEGRGREDLNAVQEQLRTEILLRIGTGEKIARIAFKGNRTIEASAIQQVLKSALGNAFSESALSDDIKAIYKMGYFDDVAAEVTETPEGKAITFVVEEKPTISEIRIQGNKEIKLDDIQAVMSVRSRQTLNPGRLNADMAKIKSLYDDKGFYNAEIHYDIEKRNQTQVRVVVSIVENEKLFIRDIGFEGNRAFTSKELKNMMTTNEWGIFHFITDSGVLKKDQLQQDVDKLKAFYMNNGFINVQIGDPIITYDRDGIRIKIPISEGKQFRVGKVTITGDELAIARAKLFEKLEIRKKDFYDREAVLKDMDYLTQACNDEGYADADVSPRTDPQEKTLTVDITYVIHKGKLVYFNRINITGNTKTRDKVIRRQLAVVEGDLYSRTKLKESYMALNRLRYFEEIDFQTEKGPNDTLTNVNIRVKEKNTGMFSVGAGYSAVDHLLLSGQITQQNLFGRGQTLSLKASVGSSSTLYDLSFTEPWLFDRPLWSKFDLWNLYREYDAYNLDSKGFGVTFGYPLWEYVTGYVGYRLSVDDVKDILDSSSYYIKAQAGERTSSGVTLTLTRDSTNDVLFPSSGSKNSATVEYTGGPLQGSISYTRYGLTSSWFFPMPLETVIGIRGRVGEISGNGGKEVPIFERYYLGGIGSLRGLREVGPKDPATGDVIGGLTMLNFNLDYIFPLIKSAGMKGVLFFDTGNTWDAGFHPEDMRKTAGFGIRWYSPIGPLRLEWGYVLDRKEEEASSRWEFSIGMFM